MEEARPHHPTWVRLLRRLRQPAAPPQVWLLADLEEISVFVIVFKQGDRFSSELARSLNSVGKLLGPIWRNTVVVVSHWSYQASAVLRRKNLRLSERKWEIQKLFWFDETLSFPRYSKALSDTL